MVSLLVHALLGVVVIAVIVKIESGDLRAFQTGSQVSALEIVYYVVGVASLALGYYFNYHFVQEYATRASNPIWGPGSWQQFIALGYANPAASSASQDYTIMQPVILPPSVTIVDGRRRGIKRPWLYLRSMPVHQLRLRMGVLSGDRRTAAPAQAIRR